MTTGLEASTFLIEGYDEKVSVISYMTSFYH